MKTIILNLTSLYDIININCLHLNICNIKIKVLDSNSREYLYSQLDQRIQLQNLVAGFIPRNSKFCGHIPKVSVMIHRRTSSQNLQKEVSTVGSPEEPTHRTPTYYPIYGGGNWLRIEGIQKRQVISEEEKVGVSL